MKKSNIMGSINSIESFGLVDGPGIRTVIFLNGCKLRCLYCHNPETWVKQELNYTVEDLVNKIVRNKPYFSNNGGVTFSGGEPLLQSEFLLEVCKELKKENIHIAIDTAGVGNNYDELFDYIDLVILDIKHVEENGYKYITKREMDDFNKFIEFLNNKNKKIWLRQVVVPGINDNTNYLRKLKLFIKKINNVEKIEFLPYHKMGIEKYEKLNIDYPLKDVDEMDKDKCHKLYQKFMNLK